MGKLIIKLIWSGLATFGIFSLAKPLLPNWQSLPPQLSQQNLDPVAFGQVLGEMAKTEVSKILNSAGDQIKTFPAKQIKKIKIGACEELLEEDICSVAREIDCQ